MQTLTLPLHCTGEGRKLYCVFETWIIKAFNETLGFNFLSKKRQYVDNPSWVLHLCNRLLPVNPSDEKTLTLQIINLDMYVCVMLNLKLTLYCRRTGLFVLWNVGAPGPVERELLNVR